MRDESCNVAALLLLEYALLLIINNAVRLSKRRERVAQGRQSTNLLHY